MHASYLEFIFNVTLNVGSQLHVFGCMQAMLQFIFSITFVLCIKILDIILDVCKNQKRSICSIVEQL